MPSEDRIRMLLKKMDDEGERMKQSRPQDSDSRAELYRRYLTGIDLPVAESPPPASEYIRKMPASKDDPPNPPRKMPYKTKPDSKGPYIKKM